MRKIRKMLAVAFAIMLLIGTLFTVTGCNILNKRTKFYNDKTLESEGLKGLPKPDFKYKGHNNMMRSIYGDITEEDFNAYAQELLEYMDENIEYFGTEGEYLDDPNSWNPSKRFVNCERKLENYRQEVYTETKLEGYTYTFVYFKEKYTGEQPTEENDYDTCKHVTISFTFEDREAKKYNYDDGSYKVKYTYNFYIQLDNVGFSTKYSDVDAKIADYYEKTYPGHGEARVVQYYSIGWDAPYYAVMIESSNQTYDDAIWTETVGDAVFHYPSSNRILLTNGYNSGFKTLTGLYNEGLISNGVLAIIEGEHRKAYPYLYEGEPSEEAVEETVE